MRPYTAMWMLFSGATLKKLLLCLLGTGLVEAGGFYHAMASELPLEAVFAQSHIPLLSAVGFFLFCAVLTLHPFQKAVTTLRRSALTPRQRFCCHAIFNSLSGLIFWGAQLALLLLLFRFYGAQAEEAVFGPQSILLAFYRNDYLHSLLPLADGTRYLRNGLLLLGLGGALALPLARMGSRGSELTAAILTLLALRAFPVPMGSRGLDLALSLIGAVVFLLALYFQDEEELRELSERRGGEREAEHEEG